MGWIARERARMQAAHVTPAWTDGAAMMLRGQLVTIRLAEAPGGGGSLILYADRSVGLSGDENGIHRAIEADLRRLAREEIGQRLHALAAQHRLTVAGFSIRNQRSRWGSCSRAGRIALNYRLVQMPPAVSDYVILHELMHLNEQNHSRRFWRLMEEVCPDYRDAERWLKLHGPGLL